MEHLNPLVHLQLRKDKYLYLKIPPSVNGFLLNQERLKPASRVEALGESTDSILQELGYDANRIQELKNEGSIR